MDKHNLAPLWEVLHNLIPNEPSTPCKPALWKYRDARPYLMEAGKLITAKEAIRRVLILENPGHARRVLHHAEPVRRPAADPAGRDRAQPPPLAVGAALHRRGLGRLHRGRRRAHDDAAGRLHHHPVLDLARPRPPRRRAGGLDGRPRHPHRAGLRRAVPRGVPGGSAAGIARRGLVGGALRLEHEAGRRQGAVRQDLADLQLSVRAAAATRSPAWRRTRIRTPAWAGRWSTPTR